MAEHASESLLASQHRFLTREAGLFDRYYQQLQKDSGRLIPYRKHFSPREAKAFLPYVVIQEVIDQDTVIVRLVGTIVANRVGRNFAGMNTFDAISREERLHASWSFQRMFTRPCATRMTVNERYSHRAVPCEVTGYPMADENGAPRFIVGVSAEIDLQELAARGHSNDRMGQIEISEFIDIGAGGSGPILK